MAKRKDQLKTRVNDADVGAFLDAQPEERRADIDRICEIMEQVTGEPARMWGKTIVGFGSYHYRYESGREGEWMLTGFSPRKRDLTLYIMSGFEAHPEIVGRLGKFRTGRSCLYVKRLSDIDVEVLQQLIEASVATMRERYG